MPNIYELLAPYFGAPSRRSDEFEELFIPQTIGKNTLSRTVMDGCLSSGIGGEFARKYMINHGPRATIISLLITSGDSDAMVALNSGQRHGNSLQSYDNLIGVIVRLN